MILGALRARSNWGEPSPSIADPPESTHNLLTRQISADQPLT